MAENLRMWLPLVAVMATIWSTTSAEAKEEFRIETKIFVGEEKTPSSKSVTIFEKGAVYDFTLDAKSGSSQQVVVYRDAAPERPGQFILLKPIDELRTEVSTDRIGPLIDKLTNWASKQPDAMLKFTAHPVFGEGFSPDKDQISLVSPEWTYDVRTLPATNEAALIRYRNFTDWYAKLNAMLYSTPPPGPRLALNASLVKHNVVPVEIHRRLNQESIGVRALHVFSWRLSRDDQQRLDEARRQLASYRKVDNATFMGKKATAE